MFKKRYVVLLLILLGVGSFGGHLEAKATTLSPFGIIDEDNRVAVENLEELPYKAIVCIEVKFPNGDLGIGTGALISEDTVLTAGHVLFNKSKGGWASKVEVNAAYDGSTPTYYAVGTEILMPAGWNDLALDGTSYDMAAIKLDRQLGLETGWLPVTTNYSTVDTLSLTGFPDDKGKTMWTDNGTISTILGNAVRYSMDSKSGNSGSPVYNQQHEIVGVHAAGISPDGGITYTSNHGTRIDTVTKKMIDFWITGQAEVEATSVSLSKDSLALLKGESARLVANILPSNASIQDGKWYTSNSSIATVDYTGTVVGKNHGTAIITFISDDNHLEAACQVTVKDEAYVAVESVSLPIDPELVEYKEQEQIVGTTSYTIVPENASNKEVSFISSNTTILDFNDNGVLSKFKTPGIVEIFVKSLDNETEYKARTICVDDHGETLETATQVEAGTVIEGFFYNRFDVDYLMFTPKNDGNYTLSLEVTDNNRQSELNKNGTISVFDEKGASLTSVNQNSLTFAMEQGKTYYVLPKLRKISTIDESYYTTNYQFSITKEIVEIETVEITNSESTLFVGEQLQMLYQLLPESKEDYSVEWRTTDKDIAEIDAVTGLLTAKNIGTTTIYLKIIDQDSGSSIAEVSKEIEIKEVPLNDSIEHAKALKLYELIPGDLNNSYTNYYKFTAPESRIYYVTSSTFPLYNENNEALGQSISTNGVELEQGKTYYFKHASRYLKGVMISDTKEISVELENGGTIVYEGRPQKIIVRKATGEIIESPYIRLSSSRPDNAKIDENGYLSKVGSTMTVNVTASLGALSASAMIDVKNGNENSTIDCAAELGLYELIPGDLDNSYTNYYKFTAPESRIYYVTSSTFPLYDENNKDLGLKISTNGVELEQGKTYYFKHASRYLKGVMITDTKEISIELENGGTIVYEDRPQKIIVRKATGEIIESPYIRLSSSRPDNAKIDESGYLSKVGNSMTAYITASLGTLSTSMLIETNTIP